jgi:hypothetical protein
MEATPSSFIVVSYVRKTVELYLIAMFIACTQEAGFQEGAVN